MSDNYYITDNADITTTEFEREGYSVETDSEAERQLQKIREIEAERDRRLKIGKDEIERIQMIMDSISDSAEKEITFRKSLLEGYFSRIPLDSLRATKTQTSYKLLTGTLVRKFPKMSVKKTDAEKLATYLLNNRDDEFVEVKAEPKWGEYKKVLSIMDGNVVDTRTGEIVPGCEVEYIDCKFEVKA